MLPKTMFKSVAFVGLIFLSILVGVTTLFAAGPYLEFLEFHQNSSGGITDFRPWSVAISPDMNYVYTVSPDQDAINIFSRNVTSGTLTYLESIRDFVPSHPTGIDGLNKTFSVVVSPDDKHVYATGHDDDALVVFSRDTISATLAGSLTFVERHIDGQDKVEGLDGVYWVTLSPDGKHVYTTSNEDHAVSVFSRAADTGKLTFVESHQDEAGGITSMRRPRRLAVSPDGNYLYVPSDSDFALVIFSRNPTTGALTLLQQIVRGVSEGSGLARSEAVVVSPDSRHVYVAADVGISVFRRDMDSGKLSLFREYRWNDENLPNLEKAHDIAISPDGRGVFVVSDIEDALLFFQRDPYSGGLFYREEQVDNQNGVDGLEHANGVVISPDMKNVYVTGFDDSAIAVFGLTGKLPETQAVFLPLVLK